MTLDIQTITSKYETRNTRSVGKLKITSFPTLCHYWELQTPEWADTSLPDGFWEGMKFIARGTTYHTTVVVEDHI